MDSPSPGSIPKWSQQLGLCQGKARSKGPPVGLLCEWQRPKHWSPWLLLSQAHEQGAGWHEEQLGLESVLIGNVGVTGDSLRCCTTAGLHQAVFNGGTSVWDDEKVQEMDCG